MEKVNKIKQTFLWLITVIGLVLTIVGSVQFLNLGLKKYIFTKADYNYCRQMQPIETPVKGTVPTDAEILKQCEDQRDSQKQSEAASATAFMIVGLPIFISFLRLSRRG
jgi:hypothetical protein